MASGNVVPFWSLEDPTHECAMEVQSLLCATTALCKRFLEQPDVVRDEVADIDGAYTRLSLLLSALAPYHRVAAE